MNNQHKASCIKVKEKGNISPTVCCRNAAGLQCILVLRSHTAVRQAVRDGTLDVLREWPLAKANVDAITEQLL